MKNDDYAKKSSAILELGNLPIEQLSETVSPPDPQDIPGIAPFIDATRINAVMYLKNALPPGRHNLSQDQIPPISDSQKKQWLEIESVIADPLKLLDAVQSSQVNSHQIQAVKAVYPAIYQEMSMKVREELGRLFMEKKQVPYARRIAIAKFLGEPIDSTMTQSSMMSIIHANAGATSEQNPQAKQGRSKPSGPEITQINKVTDLFKTPAQAEQAKKLKS